MSHRAPAPAVTAAVVTGTGRYARAEAVRPVRMSSEDHL